MAVVEVCRGMLINRSWFLQLLFVSALLVASILPVSAQTPQGICGRTVLVQIAILDSIASLDSADRENTCRLVTTAQLNGIRGGGDPERLVDLSNTGLSSLETGDFVGLNGIYRLGLGGNSNDDITVRDTNTLTTLPSDVFDGLDAVRVLVLRGTTLATLSRENFDGLSALTTLVLSNNKINTLDVRDTFQDIEDNTNLNRIDLQGNTGAPFAVAYVLKKTASSGVNPATIRATLPSSYVATSLRSGLARLSVTGGTLQVGSGAPATSVTVAANTDVTVRATGADPVVVTALAPAATQTPVRGMVVGDAVATLTAIDGASANTPATGTLAVTGTLQTGEDLTVALASPADTTDLLPDPLVLTYQWQRSADQAFTTPIDIPSSNNMIYRLTSDDGGHYIRVVVSFNDMRGFTESFTSDPTSAEISSPATGQPTITGNPAVPATLRAEVGGIADANGLGTFSYQWQRNDMADFSGTTTPLGTSDRYQLIDADAGNYINVVVSFTDGAGNDEMVTSAAVLISTTPSTNAEPTGKPAIAGIPYVGSLLTASPGDIADANNLPTDPNDFSYQWHRGDTSSGAFTAIALATNNTYTLADADQGKFIRVVVSFTDGIGTAETVESDTTVQIRARINQLPSGAPEISGIGAMGERLTVDTSGIADANGLGTFSYQWQRSDHVDFASPISIAGATDDTYILQSDDAGMYIRVSVSFTDGALNDEMVPSNAIGFAGTDLCDRTPAVQTAILSRLSPADCVTVTTLQLGGLTGTLTLPSDAGLTALKAGDFAGLNRLAGITIDGANSVPVLIDGLFSDLGNLTSLVMSGVDLVTIPSGAFTGLSALTTLNLANNGIESLPEGVFDGLSALTTLNLEGNDGAPFSIAPYTIVNITSGGSPLQVTLELRLPSYVTSAQRSQMAALSLMPATGGTLSATSLVASTPSTPSRFTVTQAGDSGVEVRAVPSDGSLPDQGIALVAAQPVSLFNSAATGVPAITGTAMSGQRLAVDTSSIADVNGLGAFSYRWHKGDAGGFTQSEQTRIDGATASEYVLTDDDVDAYVRVVVSFTDGVGSAEERASAATAKVGGALFTTQTMSAVEAIADLSTATAFTSAVSSFLDSPSAGLSIDGQSAGSRWQSVLRALVPTGDSSGQCLPSESDKYERLLSSSTTLSSPCNSFDQDELGRRLRQATEVGDIALALLNPQSGIDLWLHATSYEVSGTPQLKDNSTLNYEGDGMLAYLGLAFRAGKRVRFGFTFGTSESSVDLALVSGGTSNDNVSRNLMFNSGFIDYRMGERAQYSLRIVLGQGSGDAEITLVDDDSGDIRKGTADADLSFATLSFSREFDLSDNWQIVSLASWATSRGETDAVTLTGDGIADIQSESGSSSATEFKLELDARLIFGRNHNLTFGGALRQSTGDLGDSAAADLITRYQGGRLNLQMQKQIAGSKNEIDTFSLEFALARPKAKSRNRFGFTLGTDYNRSSSYYEPLGDVRRGPLSLGYFGRLSYGFGKENTAGSGLLSTRLRLNQDGEASSDLNLNIRF